MARQVTEKKSVEIIIDKQRVRVEQGERILWAALAAGIEIPHLCAIKEAYPPLGTCRLCLVEVEGQGVVASCVEPVREGMVVHTDGERATALRRRAMELLLADHPLKCKECSKKGTCEFLTLAFSMKVKQPRLLRPFPREKVPVDASHPRILFDPNQCIQCGRCVWACKERVGEAPLDFIRKGYAMRLTTFMGRPLAETGCTGCGAGVEVCPVAALCLKGTG
ncbi:MAG: 2Fe-2S iron-sulfur cluster-binding protein [Desulfobacterales bacterium]|nr:2Fe-2S iron-sulfur cluster-binding protein [Desulfobacterales bacterium]